MDYADSCPGNLQDNVGKRVPNLLSALQRVARWQPSNLIAVSKRRSVPVRFPQRLWRDPTADSEQIPSPTPTQTRQHRLLFSTRNRSGRILSGNKLISIGKEMQASQPAIVGVVVVVGEVKRVVIVIASRLESKMLALECLVAEHQKRLQTSNRAKARWERPRWRIK